MRNRRHAAPPEALASLVILVAIQALLISLTGAAQDPDHEIRKETVVPGIEHTVIVRTRPREVRETPGSATSSEKDRWLINILEIDPTRARLDVALALDEIVGAETTSSIAQRHGALAAINGGYFRTTGIVRGEPVGVFFRSGRLLSEAVPNRAGLSVAFEKSGIRAAITRVASDAEVRVSNSSRKIDGINRPRETDELILYTPEFHRTTLTRPEGIEVVVVGSRVTSITSRGSQVIPDHGYVLSAAGTAKAWIEKNFRTRQSVTISMTTTRIPAVPFKVGFSIGGGPQLVSHGKPADGAEFTSFSESLIQSRHPRTAVGITRNGRLLFITVDGRQPSLSVGMTIAELTALMVELGCAEAINLDGGGSTTMVIRDKVVNRPSDQTGERPVSDALLIFAHPEERPHQARTGPRN